MRRQRWWLPLVALVIAVNWKPTLTLPVPDEELDTSTKLLGSSVVTSVSIITGASDNAADNIGTKTSTADRRRVIPSADLPASPADLMRPDKFQFFTLNKDGNVVTKQMTEKEIQSLIAAGGGHLPLEIHEPQNVGDMPTGGMKVADVVQNVQNVLKSELNKPATVMTSVPTIPGHVNTEWSSILPAILGGDTETGSVSEPGSPLPSDVNETPIIPNVPPVKIPDSTVIQPVIMPTKKPESSLADSDNTKQPIESVETETHHEKPMIQVPVITVDHKLPSNESEEDSMPVFQMLNTISADKVNAKNNTNSDQKSKPAGPDHDNVTEKDDVIVEPEKVAVELPLVKEPIVEKTAVVNDKVPEMIEINYTSGNIKPSVISHIVKPIVKPESDTSASMSVISQTHTTSMKISGHGEIPLREPSAPIVDPDDHTQDPVESNKLEYGTEKSPVLSTIESELKSTAVPAQTTTDHPIESSTEHNLFSEEVPLFENVPQMSSSIVPEIIVNEPVSTTHVVEDSIVSNPSKTSESITELLETSDRIKTPEITTLPTTQTTIGSIGEAMTSKTPTDDKEPLYQMLPAIIPENKTQVHGTSLSEASSIEHIIETLNDPTSSISSTVAADHFSIHKTPQSGVNTTKADINDVYPPESTTVIEIHTSTFATPLNMETLVESNSAKPMEPLPTELADSLTSMISQISDVRPSVLPLGQSAGLDTAGKKNVINVNAEKTAAVENTTVLKTQNISKIPEDPLKKGQTSVSAKPEEPSIAATTVADNLQNSVTSTVASAIISTEKSQEADSTEVSSSIETTTHSSNIDSSTTLKNDAFIVDTESFEVPIKKIDQVITQYLETTAPEPEKPHLEIDGAQASSEITTDTAISQGIVQDSPNIETKTKSTTTEATPEEKNFTNISSAIYSSSTSPPSSTVSNDHTETPIILQPESPTIVQQPESPTIVQQPLEVEDSKTEKPSKIETNEKSTELPIVRLDILETVPPELSKANNSEPTKNEDDGEESPLVRIKLTDPVSQINSMIESSNLDVRPPPLVPLTLPQTGSVPSNNIASGLIAGFPSYTNTLTTTINLNAETNSTSVDPVESSQEVVILNGTAASNVTEDLKVNDSEKSEVQAENIPITVTQGLEKKDEVPEKIETTATSTNIVPITDLVTSTEKVDISTFSSLVDSTEKLSTAYGDSNPEMTENLIKTAVPITETTTRDAIEIKAPTTETSSTPALESQNTSTKLVEKVTVSSEESAMAINVSSISESLTNGIETPVPEPIAEQLNSDDKLLESSKINKISTMSPKPEITTVRTVPIEIETKKPEAYDESTFSTDPQVHHEMINITSQNIPIAIASQTPMTDMNEAATTAVPKGPEDYEEIQALSTTQDSQLVTTTNSPVKVLENVNEPNSTVMLQESVVSTTEKVRRGPSEDNVAVESNATETEKINSNVTSTLSEKTPGQSSLPTTLKQTEEVRIQVNDTAVLVTKRPIADVAIQKPGDAIKSPESQSFEEQPTTPKVSSVTEESYGKLGEKNPLPVAVKVNNLSSMEDSGVGTISKKNAANTAETKTHIHLDDAQTERVKVDEIPAKVEDTRKAIKKDSDINILPIEEKVMTVDPNAPANADEKLSDPQEKNTDQQLPTKIQITMNVNSHEASNSTSNSNSVQLQEKPGTLPENQTPSRIVSERPISKPGKPARKPALNIKKDDAPGKPAKDHWTLISQTVSPAATKTGGTHVRKTTTTEVPLTITIQDNRKSTSTEKPPVPLDHLQSASGLDSTVKNLEPDVSYFVNLCNELAFSFWTATNKGLSNARSLAVSPFGMTSMLAMVFLGARGPTSDQMNDVLKLDDVASFNPHLVFQNVTDAVSLARNQGIANAAFVRELFADRSKVRKLMPFYKEQAQQFYDGIVAEVNFATISDLVRRRTNLMIRKQTGGRIKDFVRTNTVPLRSPLAALSANVFQTNCNSSAASSEGRDGELYFAVSPAVRQRKLIPVPATVWRAGVLAGYEPSLDATAVALGGTDKLVSTIFVIPGQQGLTAPGDTLDRLEQRLVRGATHDSSWNKLLKVLIPRPGLELQVPKFSHRSVINATAALKRMGLEELFSKHADLKGINGVATDLHLADVLQMNLFSTCGDENIISGRHHVEVYPGSPLRNAREYDALEQENDDALIDYPSSKGDGLRGSELPYVLQREARSARQNETTEKQRLKLDRPFLYFVRHNPTGLILHMGRFNPRLLP